MGWYVYIIFEKICSTSPVNAAGIEVVGILKNIITIPRQMAGPQQRFPSSCPHQASSSRTVCARSKRCKTSSSGKSASYKVEFT